MEDLKKKILKILMITSFILAGVFFTYWISNIIKNKINKPTTTIIVNNEKELKTIDSLTEVINIKEELIQQLKDSIVIVEKVVIKEIDKIKELPITDNVLLLKDNLVYYGELSEVDDLYPSLIEVDNDTFAVLSENNLIDANIITAKYEGELYKNKLLNDIVYNDSVTISLKDNIIYNKDMMLQNQEQSYNSIKENLEIALKKEKQEKTYWIIGGVAVTTLLTSYIIFGK
jgi:hypothetical protein